MAALLNGGFNAHGIDPSQGVGQLPIGRHLVEVIRTEIKANSANTGGYLMFILSIVDGPNAGLEGPHRFNLYNASEEAKNIAQRQFSAVCHVTGIMEVQDSDQFLGARYFVEVGLQKGEEAKEKGYTEIKKVYDINGNEPGKQGQGQGQQTNQNQSGFGNQNQGQQQNGFGNQQQANPQGQQQGAGFGTATNVQMPGNQGQQQTNGGFQGQTQGQQQNVQQPAQGQPAWGNQQNGGQQQTNAPAWGQARQ